MWLGVPFGTDAFVEAELRRQIRDHDKRLRGVAAYAGCDGAAVSHKGVRLSRQLAIAALKFSANARDVHFLRSLGRRAVGEAAELHGWLEYRFVNVTCCNIALCMHEFCARASAPWKIFCFLLKFLLKTCYKCRVGSKKSESREVGWSIGAKSGSEGPVQTYDTS